MTERALALLLAAGFLGCRHEPRAPAGPALRLSVSLSQTAQIFHIVDQLSAWSPYCHAQYAKWFALNHPLDADDRKLLADHAALRARHGWGQGLEQSFYVDLPIEAAVAAAVEQRRLLPEEAASERRVLAHFAPVLQDVLELERPLLEDLRARILAMEPQIEEQARSFARLVETDRSIELKVFLVANPDRQAAGGGYSGGRMVIEAPGDLDIGDEFARHGAFDAFLTLRGRDIEKAAFRCDGLDTETLHEALAYAWSPGLAHARAGDPLAREVEAAKAKPLTNPYVRFRRLALALRGPLDQALRNGGKLESVLKEACPRWQALQAIPAEPR